MSQWSFGGKFQRRLAGQVRLGSRAGGPLGPVPARPHQEQDSESGRAGNPRSDDGPTYYPTALIRSWLDLTSYDA
jgi:hypothetical protein